MRVLLVDDEEEFVSTLAERLTIRGIDAEWTLTGLDAIRRAESESFDLAVLDLKIPKMGGIDLKNEYSYERLKRGRYKGYEKSFEYLRRRGASVFWENDRLHLP
jgi:DNA-binding NtrC family response regulator